MDKMDNLSRNFPLNSVYFLFILISVADAKPNIVFFLADDLGWADVGYSKYTDNMKTPNIDQLVERSLKIENAYTLPICTPSRAALMTGVYPHRYGLQYRGVLTDSNDGLDLKLRTLPEMLRGNGYTTHLVGKWHLGYCKKAFTPLRRGFDTFFGFLGGEMDYLHHYTTHKNKERYDYRLNNDIYHSKNYSMHDYLHFSEKVIKNRGKSPFFLLFSSQAVHAPLQVPPGGKATSSKRQIFHQMAFEMDRVIGKLIKTLKNEGIWKDTVFIFSSDNGGEPFWGGSNYPLKGAKNTLWEGGTRVRTFIHYGQKLPRGEYPGLFHFVDWVPTILQGILDNKPDDKFDGINQWPALVDPSRPHPRQSVIYTIGKLDLHGETHINAAIRMRHYDKKTDTHKDYKLVLGHPGDRNGRYKPGKTAPLEKSDYYPTGRLYDMSLDQKLLEENPIQDEDMKKRMITLIHQDIEKGCQKRKKDVLTSKAWKMKDKHGLKILAPGWC